jgi:hypothetical protein
VGPALIFLLFAALVVAFIVMGIVQAAKRRQAWQELARRLGCSYSADDPHEIQAGYSHPLFQCGHSRKAYNVLSGQVEKHALLCFDYLYKITSGSGKNRRTTTYYQTCLLLPTPIPFQTLAIRPESFLDRVGEFFGLDDIDFESDEFSRAFHVKCGDKKFAYDILHARAMELLLECGKVHIEAEAQSILFYYTGSRRVPEEVEAMIRSGIRFLDLVPDYLIEDVARRP